MKQLLSEGHEVTAFARKPQKLQQDHPKLHLVAGDALNPADVTAAIAGQDAVVVTLGSASLRQRIRAEGTLNVIRAMQQTGVRRLICQSTLGARESWGNLNFYWKYIMFGMLLRKAYADHGKQEQYIRESSLDWTIVRPGALKEGPLTNTYRQGFGPAVRDITLEISIADTADFMVRQIDDTTYLSGTHALSY